MKHRTRAFTLIELLVVVAIIGLLSSVVLSSLTTARIKARDAERLSDMRQIRNALEIYHSTYGHYPRSTNCGGTTPNAHWCNSVQTLSNGRWIKHMGSPALTSFISEDPVDPRPAGSANWVPVNGGTYYYFSHPTEGDGYLLVFGLERYPSSLESTDGVIMGGNSWDYGSGSNGVITFGSGD